MRRYTTDLSRRKERAAAPFWHGMLATAAYLVRLDGGNATTQRRRTMYQLRWIIMHPRCKTR